MDPPVITTTLPESFIYDLYIYKGLKAQGAWPRALENSDFYYLVP
jgi:hypothetical protein